MKFLLLAFLISSIPPSFAELYDGPNHPNNFRRLMGTNLVLDFDALPISGKLSDDRLGWSEAYWPSNKGGIAYRWNHPNPTPFKFKLHTREELQKMSREELDQLSPSELYDIANNDYNYTLTRRALSLYNPRDLWWEGICHGWAQAATHYPEPKPVVVRNNAGIQVPFGSSDVKALLAMHEAYNYKGEEFGFVGKRCRVNGKVEGEGGSRDTHPNPPASEEAESADCRDVNAGSFHVVTTNMIGILGKGFVADVDRFNDVWNQPVTNYSSQILGDEPVDAVHSAQGIARRIRVKTKFVYGEELMFYSPEAAARGAKNFVSKKPVTLTPHQEYRHKDYEYIVELNANGRVIGGEWITETRPDFIWNYKHPKTFKNSPIPLAALRFIYQPLRR